MEKEKIVLGNNTELEYDSIGFRNGCLVIGFVGGDAEALETAFREAGQDNLETIRQLDASGSLQATHQLYDILQSVNKQIDAEALESGEKADVVEIVLARESAELAAIRRLEKRVNENQEVTDALLMGYLTE